MKKISAKQAALVSAHLLQTTPDLPGAEDFFVMENRQHILDALYVIDGRDKRSHKLHGLYTGLWQKYFKA